MNATARPLWRVRLNGIFGRLFGPWSPWLWFLGSFEHGFEGPIRVHPGGLVVLQVLQDGGREHLYPVVQLRPLTLERLREFQWRQVPLCVQMRDGRIVGVTLPDSYAEEPASDQEIDDDGGTGEVTVAPASTSGGPGIPLGTKPALHVARIWQEASSQALRWNDDGVNPPQLAPLLPSAIPTSFRGKIELLKKAQKVLVCQHLPHPGGRDYQFYLADDLELSLEELERAQWRQSTVIVTLQHGKVVEAHIPRQQNWEQGLWQSRGRGGFGLGR